MTIMRLPGDGGAPEPIAEAVADGDFHAWTPDRVLLMADGARVFARRYESDATWEEIADFSDLHVILSRLAVSPDGAQIALVAELDALELPTKLIAGASAPITSHRNRGGDAFQRQSS